MRTAASDQARYRRIIDLLVEACQEGQGQVGARRARAGVWNRNAGSADGPLADQWQMNQLLLSLTTDQREVLAKMLAQEFISGVHESLVVLHGEKVTPLDDGYAGDPYRDFAGRLDGWTWPAQ